MNPSPEIKNEFESVFRQYYQSLCSYAYSFVKDMESSEDVVQEVFVRVWEKQKLQIGADKIKFYLFTAVRNNCLTLLQKSKKNIIQELKDEDAVDTIILENKKEGREPAEIISQALQQLPPKCREVFLLSRVSGFTYRQIAESLDISVKTVENQMGKAISILKKFAKENSIYPEIVFCLFFCIYIGQSVGVFIEKWFYQ